MALSEMPTYVALPTSHHFHPSLKPIVSLSLGILDENADASQAIFEPPPENWRRPPGQPRTTRMKNIHDDLSSLDLGIHEARDQAQNRPLWRLMFLHSRVATRPGFPGMSRICPMLSRVPARPAPGRQMSRISR